MQAEVTLTLDTDRWMRRPVRICLLMHCWRPHAGACRLLWCVAVVLVAWGQWCSEQWRSACSPPGTERAGQNFGRPAWLQRAPVRPAIFKQSLAACEYTLVPET